MQKYATCVEEKAPNVHNLCVGYTEITYGGQKERKRKGYKPPSPSSRDIALIVKFDSSKDFVMLNRYRTDYKFDSSKSFGTPQYLSIYLRIPIGLFSLMVSPSSSIRIESSSLIALPFSNVLVDLFGSEVLPSLSVLIGSPI